MQLIIQIFEWLRVRYQFEIRSTGQLIIQNFEDFIFFNFSTYFSTQYIHQNNLKQDEGRCLIN